MPLRYFASVVVLVLVASCGGTDDDGAAASVEPTTATPTTQTSAEPATTSTTTEPATTTTTTTTLPPVTDLESGLFCRDIFPLGYDYAAAVTYWVKEGSPDRMDADRNGIPCETVYAEADVLAFWGDPLPTTAPPSSLTFAWLESYVGEAWEGAGGDPIDWACFLEHGNKLSSGAAAVCIPSMVGEGQYPVLTALILDDVDTVAVAQSGVENPELSPGVVSGRLGSGKFCREVLDPEIGIMDWVTDPELRHFGAVLYWFEEGRPDRMDADINGRPCETLVSAGIVADFWNGGFVGEAR